VYLCCASDIHKKVIAINDDNDDNNTKKVCPTGCHCRHSAYVTVCV
jgi:hypothetical protein